MHGGPSFSTADKLLQNAIGSENASNSGQDTKLGFASTHARLNADGHPLAFIDAKFF